MTNFVTNPSWPAVARAACALTFDLDAETLRMARGASEPVMLSQGRFAVLSRRRAPERHEPRPRPGEGLKP